MKYCELFEALLDPYVDGELSAEEMERVQSHLAICPGCQAYVDHALAIRAAFPDVEETTNLPDGFAEGVCAAVRMTPQTKKKTPWIKVLAPLAACLAVVVVLQSGPFAGGGGSAAPHSGSAPRDAAVPEAAMADQALPEEDTERADVPVAYAMDGGETAPADAPMDAPMDDAASAKAYTGLPFAELTLTAAQAGEALADCTPVSQEAGTLVYHLTAEEYEALLTALTDIQAPLAVTTGVAVDENAYALVTVTP